MPDVPERLPNKTQDPQSEAASDFKLLFPGCFSDGCIDPVKIANQTGLSVVGSGIEKERFGLIWAGKNDAIRALQEPSFATLIPEIEHSIEWESSKNVFIEGDNLEVLKLLQKSYNDRVKLIYIDPPYNTGGDYVYNDDFSDSLKHYLEVTGQVDGAGNRLFANSDTSGRRSSRWLSMMYPRLLLARNLLREDGICMVSINDRELHHLTMLMNEIFGAENYISTLIWDKGHSAQAGIFKVYHEYILVFARNSNLIDTPVSGDSELFEAGAMKRESSRHIMSEFSFPAGVRFDAPEGMELLGNWGGAEKVELIEGRMICEKGKTKEPITLRAAWTQKNQMDQFFNFSDKQVLDSRGQKVVEFYFSSTGKIKIVKQRGIFTPSTSLNSYGTQAQSSNELAALFASDISPFNSPKPVKMLQDFVSWFSSGNDIVMDFFAGSGTLGHAVLKQNELDGANRRWIMVNLPEGVSESSPATKLGFKTVSEITRERIRKVSETLNIFGSAGFRSFKLGGSAFNHFTSENSEGQLSLMNSTLHCDVSNLQIAYEIFLKSGVGLDSEITEMLCSGGRILISEGVAAVLSTEVTEELVEVLLENRTIKTAVFLEDSFIQNDAIKANAYFAFKLSDKNMKTY